jgi:hypothetical protein
VSNTFTIIIMASFFVSFIAIDLWLALDKKDGNTYSENLRKWGKVWPPLRLIGCFAMGVLAGHWWWSSAI